MKFVCINEPGIFILGITDYELTKSVQEKTVMLVKQIITGQISLPNKEEMLDRLDKELRFDESIGYNRNEFYRLNPNGYDVVKYTQDLIELSAIPADTENYGPMLARALPEFLRLAKANDICSTKSLNYEEMFKGLIYNPTSEYF